MRNKQMQMIFNTLLDVIKMQIEFHSLKCGRAAKKTNSQAINMRFRYYSANGWMFADEASGTNIKLNTI